MPYIFHLEAMWCFEIQEASKLDIRIWNTHVQEVASQSIESSKNNYR